MQQYSCLPPWQEGAKGPRRVLHNLRQMVLLLTLVGICTESAAKALETSKTPQQFCLENYANAPEGLALKKGMPYENARQILIKKGWQPYLQGTPRNLRNPSVKELFDWGYEEIKDCSGTGEGPCRFEFINKKQELLIVVATTMGAENTKRFVRNWWIEKKTDSNAQRASSNIIEEGRYWLGGTDQGLEVNGGRYRYYDESDIARPWQPIAELQYVKKGVVFDGKNYWCLSTMLPKGQIASCSKNGW